MTDQKVSTSTVGLHVPSGPGSAPSDADRAWVAGLDRELRQFRPAALGALLTASGLLRVASVGAGVAIQFYISDLAGGRPNALSIGLVGAAAAVTEMIFAPILARYADRLGRSRFLLFGPLIGMFGLLLVAISANIAQIGGARLVEGVGAAAFVPTCLGIIAAATVSDRNVRARASGAFEGATLAGYAGGFGLGPFAYVALHRWAFVLFALLYGAAALVCLRFVPRVPPMPVSPLRTVIRAVLGRGPMRIFLPAWVAAFAMLGSFLSNLAAVLRHQRVPHQNLMHHFDERLIGVLLLGWIVFFLIGIALWTPLLSRGRPATIMRRAIPGAWLILAALLAINHTELALAPVFLPFLLLGVLWLAGFGPAAVTYLADCSEALVADRAALMSFYTVTLAGGGALGAVLGGLATHLFQADGLIGLAFILSTITFVLMGFVVRYDRRGQGIVGGLAVPAG